MYISDKIETVLLKKTVIRAHKHWSTATAGIFYPRTVSYLKV
jgi:hypothetical protein